MKQVKKKIITASKTQRENKINLTHHAHAVVGVEPIPIVTFESNLAYVFAYFAAKQYKYKQM